MDEIDELIIKRNKKKVNNIIEEYQNKWYDNNMSIDEYILYRIPHAEVKIERIKNTLGRESTIHIKIGNVIYSVHFNIKPYYTDGWD